MSDYISREDVLGCLYSTMESYYIKRNIMDIPAADVRENAKARWIDMGDHLLCSGCGATHYGADKNFCPNCGADMREENQNGNQ